MVTASGNLDFEISGVSANPLASFNSFVDPDQKDAQRTFLNLGRYFIAQAGGAFPDTVTGTLTVWSGLAPQDGVTYLLDVT